MDYRVDDKQLNASAFLSFVNQIWPGSYDVCTLLIVQLMSPFTPSPSLLNTVSAFSRMMACLTSENSLFFPRMVL